MIKNYINQKLCFNLLNNYIDGYTEKKQIKILNELNADSFFINKFLDNKFIGDNINNPYNLEWICIDFKIIFSTDNIILYFSIWKNKSFFLIRVYLFV